jgi:hypothetical protein
VAVRQNSSPTMGAAPSTLPRCYDLHAHLALTLRSRADGGAMGRDLNRAPIPRL